MYSLGMHAEVVSKWLYQQVRGYLSISLLVFGAEMRTCCCTHAGHEIIQQSCLPCAEGRKQERHDMTTARKVVWLVASTGGSGSEVTAAAAVRVSTTSTTTTWMFLVYVPRSVYLLSIYLRPTFSLSDAVMGCAFVLFCMVLFCCCFFRNKRMSHFWKRAPSAPDFQRVHLSPPVGRTPPEAAAAGSKCVSLCASSEPATKAKEGRGQR